MSRYSYAALPAPYMGTDGLPLILTGVALSALGIGLVLWMARPAKADRPVDQAPPT